MKRVLIFIICVLACTAHGMEQQKQSGERDFSVLVDISTEQPLVYVQKRKAGEIEAEVLLCAECGFSTIARKRGAFASHMLDYHKQRQRMTPAPKLIKEIKEEKDIQKNEARVPKEIETLFNKEPQPQAVSNNEIQWKYQRHVKYRGKSSVDVYDITPYWVGQGLIY